MRKILCLLLIIAFMICLGCTQRRGTQRGVYGMRKPGVSGGEAYRAYDSDDAHRSRRHQQAPEHEEEDNSSDQEY